ncbi:hypothetical protein CDL15_Pgr027441 [Punica granatum]|nr:hypothetical protein CDL15_Pgr027441 [Punica granatum]
MVGDRTSKVVPSLAVVEKRQALRPTGGCVGLFQLFDWHRRFSKKKLFSRKLLPPARPKQATRNFKGDEKMPVVKLHYIADENKAGFPNSRKTKNINIERKHEMGTPGLVARLMGLESMPSVSQEKVDEASSHEIYDYIASKSELTNKGLGREEINLEKGQMRHERPQKLQKTGLSEGRAVTRFGTEALHIKGALSRSRKQNHPKLASPVKSPRISSLRNVSHKSRLIGAATKILEPGLQAKNRINVLTYSESMHYVPSDQVILESSATEQTPYINCGHMLKNTNISQYMDNHRSEYAPAGLTSSGLPNASYRDSVGHRKAPIVPVDKQKVFCKRRQEESLSLKEAKRLPPECQEPWHLRTKKGAPQREESSSVAPLKSRRVSSAASSVSGTKDFVALNRSLSGQTRPRVPSKAESSSIDETRRSRGRRDDSISHLRSPARRMRTASSNQQVGSVNIRDSTLEKQRKVTPVAVTGNGKTSDKSSVISFTFNSPWKQKTSSSTEAEDRRSRESDDSGDLVLEGRDKKAFFQEQLALRGDALGALLEQKLKELISQEEDESTSGSTLPKRSTAMILQELIAALTTDPTLSQETDTPETNKAFQVKSRKERSVAELPCDANHFSPGSVLDASFSNDSCVSSSLDDSSGLNLLTDFIDFSCDVPQPRELDGDLSDFATTLEKHSAHGNIMINLIGCISRALSQLNLAGLRLSGSKLSYTEEVILHTEMLFSGTTHPSMFGTEEIIVSPSLLDELESLAISAWMSIGWLDGLVNLKEGKQLKEFLFDCLLECLDSKYHPCSDFGYRKWSRLPRRLNDNTLVWEVEGGLKTWAGLTGMSVDEMIEWEMNHSLGKWVDFDIEAFENGCDIERDILQGMVEEIVDDILQYS